MNENVSKQLVPRWLETTGIMVLGLPQNVQPSLAVPLFHEAPKGSEWIMADWMFLSFLIFAGIAFVAFLWALKAGWLSNLEDAKYYILEIDEEDYYTPEWAQEGDEA
jgi:cbb3-type cytochrome oxidase maturation protein